MTGILANYALSLAPMRTFPINLMVANTVTEVGLRGDLVRTDGSGVTL